MVVTRRQRARARACATTRKHSSFIAGKMNAWWGCAVEKKKWSGEGFLQRLGEQGPRSLANRVLHTVSVEAAYYRARSAIMALPAEWLQSKFTVLPQTCTAAAALIALRHSSCGVSVSLAVPPDSGSWWAAG